MDAIVKVIVDSGIGMASLAAFTYICVQQLTIIREFKKTMEENTNATRALSEKITESITQEREVVRIVSGCPARAR